MCVAPSSRTKSECISSLQTIIFFSLQILDNSSISSVLKTVPPGLCGLQKENILVSFDNRSFTDSKSNSSLPLTSFKSVLIKPLSMFSGASVNGA